MGRASTKENKTVYQITREELKLTREKASELIGHMSAEHIEKIENNKINVQPDDVLALSECYKTPKLCNYYCANECPIGQKYIPEIQMKDIAQIAVETLNSLNKINREKDRLLEIIEDGTISEDEITDFVSIKKTLDKISLSIDTFKLWINQAVADGDLDVSIFSE